MVKHYAVSVDHPERPCFEAYDWRVVGADIIDWVTFEGSPILKTEGLMLREFAPTDVPAVLAFRGDPHVQRFNSEPLRNAAQALAFIEELRTEQAAGRSISWAISLARVIQR